MIEFNVTPSRIPAGHRRQETLMERTSKWWTCADSRLDEYGDVALAIESNYVSDGFLINGWARDNTGKQVLDLVALSADHPAAAWIGRPAPVPWTSGQRQPFKYISWRGLVPPPPPLFAVELTLAQDRGATTDLLTVVGAGSEGDPNSRASDTIEGAWDLTIDVESSEDRAPYDTALLAAGFTAVGDDQAQAVRV